MPVVTPSRASIDTVNAVCRRARFWLTIGGRSSSSQRSGVRQRHTRPRPCFAMKLMVSLVADSAAIVRSPSFSRSSSSQTTTSLPARISASASSMVANGGSLAQASTAITPRGSPECSVSHTMSRARAGRRSAPPASLRVRSAPPARPARACLSPSPLIRTPLPPASPRSVPRPAWHGRGTPPRTLRSGRPRDSPASPGAARPGW